MLKMRLAMNDNVDRRLEDIKLLEKQAWRLFNQKQYSEALVSFEKIFGIDPNNIAAFQGKIATLRLMRDFAGATKLLKKALIVHPEQPGVLSERAWLLRDQRKIDEAIDAFGDVLKVFSDEGMFVAKSNLLRTQRRFEEAKRLIQDGAEAFPGSVRIRSERGWLHFDQKQYDEAISVFEDILKDNPSLELALQGQIASLRCKGNYSDATKLANTALRLVGKSPGIYSERG